MSKQYIQLLHIYQETSRLHSVEFSHPGKSTIPKTLTKILAIESPLPSKHYNSALNYQHPLLPG